MRKIFIPMFIAASILTACNKQENKDTNEKTLTASELKGNWVDYHYPDIKPEQPDAIYFAHSRYRFQFGTDSFKMQVENVTDALIDSCMNDYNEFAKGKWTLNGRALSLEGIYTNVTYTDAMTGSCYHNGSFSYKTEAWLSGGKLMMKQAKGMGSFGGKITLVKE